MLASGSLFLLATAAALLPSGTRELQPTKAISAERSRVQQQTPTELEAKQAAEIERLLKENHRLLEDNHQIEWLREELRRLTKKVAPSSSVQTLSTCPPCPPSTPCPAGTDNKSKPYEREIAQLAHVHRPLRLRRLL